MEIDKKYSEVLLEAIEDKLYTISMRMEELKGGEMTTERKGLETKQKELEALQHAIFLQLEN